MAVAYDVSTRFPLTENTADITTGSRTFSHAGSASTRAAVVVACYTTTVRPFTGILYGGVAMIRQQTATDTTEAGQVDVYILTRAVPTGTQTVTVQGATATPKFFTCSTVTAGTPGVAVHTSGFVNTSTGTAAQVSLVLSQPSCSFAGVHHGAATASATPVAGCTLQNNRAYGVLSANTVRRTSVDTSGTVALGVTIANEDYCAAAVALSEATLPVMVMHSRLP